MIRGVIGKRLSHYQITAKIGSGGMGEVYRADDTRLERPVALKVLPDEMASDRTRLSRFRREAKTVAALNHPNIVTIFSVEEADGVQFLTMELVAGKGIDQLLPADGFPLERFFELAIPIADAVASAHARGIVHRDLKPANVMVTDEGKRVKVLDFGLAKQNVADGADGASRMMTLTQTRDGQIVGTPYYMSPEQARGEAVDHRSDVFSLGVMFFEMATGRLPFRGQSAIELLSAILKDPAPPLGDLRPGMPRHLGRVIGRCLEKAPEDRYQTARDVFNELRALREETRSGAVESHSRPAVPGVEPKPTPRPTRRGGFVGRAAERAQLDAALEGARQGRGGLVLLGGEPGVGKTRLASEILEDGRERGMLALTGHAYEDATVPFILTTEMLEEMVRLVPEPELREMLGVDASELSRLLPALRKLFPDIPQPEELPAEQQQRVLFNAVLDLLRRASSRSPLVVLLDDVHWADESSLKMLEHIAPRLGELPILMIGTYRAAETEMGEAFTRTLANLVRQRLLERITIQCFDERAVGELLAARGGSDPPDELVAAVHQGTEGNAFFVEEVFRNLSEEGLLFDADGGWRSDLDIEALDVPEGVRLVIGRRLERLADNTRQVLTTAAAIGLRFDLNVLEEAVAGPDAALDGIEEAESAQLVLPSPGQREIRYEFSHALVRQTLLRELSPLRRQRLHLRVADAMEAVLADDLPGHAADIAYQLHEAGRLAADDRTRRFLALAGVQALAAAAAEEARDYFDRALELSGDLGEAERGELLLERGNANRARGDLEAAAVDWEAAVPLLESAGRSGLVAGTCWQIAWKLNLQRRISDAETYAIRGLTSAGDEPSVERSRLLAMLGHIESHRANFDRSDELISEAVAMAEELRDERLLGLEVLLSRTYQYEHTARVTRLLETGERAIELARRSGRPWDLSAVIGSTLMPFAWGGRFARSRELTDEVEPVAAQEGDALTIGHVRVARAQLALSQGDLAAAREHCRGCTEVYKAAGFPWFSVPLAMEGRIAMLAGEWREARELLEEAARCKLPGNFAGLEEAHLAQFLAYAGDPRAPELLDALEPLLPRAGVTNGHGSWVVLLMSVEPAVLLGQHERAARLYPLTLELMAQGAVTLWASGLTERIAGIAAAAGKRWAEAEAHFTEALKQAEELPYLPGRTEVRYWYARMLLDRDEPGDDIRAETLLGEAAGVCRQIGMPLHLERVEAKLGDLRAARRGVFVGREAERSQLDGMLAEAAAGRGALVLLGGEPGVGKTRLATEILEDGRVRGMLALTGHAYEEQAAPFTLSTEILEEMVRLVPRQELREMLGGSASQISRFLPELRTLFSDIPQPEELPPEQQQRVLFNSVLDFLRQASERSPLVMLLDDVHWADESSLALLEHVAPRLAEMPILVMGTYRDAEIEMGKAFSKTLANLVRRRLVRRLAVRSFDASTVAALLAARGGSDPPRELVAAIHEGTEGNAFYVEELFRHLSEEGLLFDEYGGWRADLDVEALDVPEGVRLVTGRRLERLAENTRKVLTTAAGIGLRFDLGVLEAAVGDPDAALDGIEEAESAQLVLPAVGRREARYEFSHALIRQTLLAELSVPRLQRLHLGIADAMEAVHGDRAAEHAPDLAQQLLAAGARAGSERTRRYLRLAGEQALDAAAPEEALLAFERALELEEDLPAEERAQLLFLRGLACRTLGRHGDAAAIWTEALPLLESVRRVDLVADVCRQLAYYHCWAQGFDEAKAMAQRGLEATGEAPSRERIRLLAIQVLVHSCMLEFEEADRLSHEAIAIATELGEHRLHGGEALLTRLYRCEHSLRANDLVETGARAIDLVRRHGSPWDQTSTIGATLLGRFFHGEFELLRQHIDEILPLAEREGNVGTLVHCLACSSLAALATDDLESAIDWSGRFIRLGEQYQMPWGSLGYPYRGVARMWSNRLVAAASDFERGIAVQLVAKTHYGIEAAGALYGFAMMGSQRASELYDSDYPLPVLDRDSPEGAWHWCMARVQAAVLLGRTEEAAEWLPHLERLMGQGVKVSLGLGLTAKFAGLAAAAGNDPAAAERHFETAIRQADELPYHTEQAETRRWYAWALARFNRPEDRQRANELREAAAAKYRELGGFRPVASEA